MRVLFVINYLVGRHQGYTVPKDLEERIWVNPDTKLEEDIQELLKDPIGSGFIPVEDKDIAGCSTFLVGSIL